MGDSSSKTIRRKGGPRKATARHLRNAALAHLNRYPTSAGHLRRLLLARVARSARLHDTDPEAGSAVVEALITEFSASGWLDDRAYAAGRAETLFRRGASARAIEAELAGKQIAPDLIRQALARLGEVAADPELCAALRFARKRRLGPYRPADDCAARRGRDLAALARKGFDLELSRRIIDAADVTDLEREAVLDDPADS